MGFTETHCGESKAPLGDCHSTAPAEDRWTTWPSPSATQQEPSVGFTETDCTELNAPLADRQSSVPVDEKCTTAPSRVRLGTPARLPVIRRPAGAVRGVHRDGHRQENAPLPDFHSCVPADERWATKPPT